MKEKRNLLEKWLEFREEELECGLSKEDILDSMEHFNKKYYMAGFCDALEIILKM